MHEGRGREAGRHGASQQRGRGCRRTAPGRNRRHRRPPGNGTQAGTPVGKAGRQAGNRAMYEAGNSSAGPSPAHRERPACIEGEGNFMLLQPRVRSRPPAASPAVRHVLSPSCPPFHPPSSPTVFPGRSRWCSGQSDRSPPAAVAALVAKDATGRCRLVPRSGNSTPRHTRLAEQQVRSARGRTMPGIEG